MVSKIIKQVRCDDVLASFMENSGQCVFFTLTTPDVVDIYEIRDRWRRLRHYLVEMLPTGTKYVMNYEIHPKGHGWHIHSVWTNFIPLKTHIKKIQSFGFGRVDVKRVTSKGVSDYLTKHALKAYRGVSQKMGVNSRLRLVNCSRGLPVLSDYHWQSEDKKKIDEQFKSYNSFMASRLGANELSTTHKHFINSMPFGNRYQLFDLMFRLGINGVYPAKNFINSLLTNQPQIWYNSLILKEEECKTPIQQELKLKLKSSHYDR